MKVRSDYVSNSSSSSFILGHHEFFDFFHITKEDIFNALVDAYGKDDYKKAVATSKKFAKKYPDSYKEEVKYNKFGPFWVYDLADEKDREEAIAHWGNLLKGWHATNCTLVTHGKDKGKVSLCPGKSIAFNSIMENLHEIYDILSWELKDIAAGTYEDKIPERFIHTNEKDPKTGLYGHYEPLPKSLVVFIKKLWKDSGMMTNLDVLKHGMARFFVHASDNELPCSDADEYEESHTGKRETEGYTYDRVCEILLEYLEKTGRVNAHDPKFLEMMTIDDKYLTESEKKNGEIYDFANGKNFTWKDLKNATLTWCMHEG